MARRPLWIVAFLLLTAPAAAQNPAPALTSPTVEHVRNLPLSPPPDGGRQVGRHFYVTSRSDVKIFDVADPQRPVLLSRLPVETGSRYPVDAGFPTGYQEDVDTNGRILIRSFGELIVIDVSDPRAPRELSRLPGFDGHTVTCVLDCTWVYSSDGRIADLRDPRRPVLADSLWRPELEAIGAHDVTEVAPGVVLAASQPMLLLDARRDPAHPQELARTDLRESPHGTHWPNQAEDRFALVGGEAAACVMPEGPTLSTYDTAGWRETGEFKYVDSYSVPPGVVADGRMPASTFCAHWFDPHPSFRDGGPVAMAWYEQGTRFIRVKADGRMEEAGWFLPLNAYAYAAHWIDERTVYMVDMYRGLDILRFTGEIPPAPAPPAPAAPVAQGKPKPVPRRARSCKAKVKRIKNARKRRKALQRCRRRR